MRKMRDRVLRAQNLFELRAARVPCLAPARLENPILATVPFRPGRKTDEPKQERTIGMHGLLLHEERRLHRIRNECVEFGCVQGDVFLEENATPGPQSSRQQFQIRFNCAGCGGQAANARAATQNRVADYAREKRTGGGERKGMRKLKVAARHCSAGGAQATWTSTRCKRRAEERKSWESERKRNLPAVIR
jgi:hypothetical protein